MSEIKYNAFMEHFAEMIVKYGLPMVISVVCVAGMVDLYFTLKKNWVPAFLESFKNIGKHVEGLDESLQALANEVNTLIQEIGNQTPKIDRIEMMVEDLKKTIEKA